MARPRKKPPAAQSAIAVRNQYDAAGRGRRMKGWNPPTSGPNQAVTPGIQPLRNRARDATRNDWAGESSVQKWVTTLIGVGITPRLKRVKSARRKKVLNDLWDAWVQQSDADGVLNFYGQQALATRAWLESGEVFARLRVRRMDGDMEVPMQVQLIESDYVPHFDSDLWPGMPVGNKIRSGIELDRRGKRVAYWMHREHPSEGHAVVDQSRLLRIPADQVAHIYEVKRPGQLRGVPALATVLARLRSISDFDDAVLERQKLANLFTAFITRGVGAGADIDPLTNLPVEYDNSGTPLAGLQPGLMQELDYGEDVKFANPPEAGTTYSDYVRTQHLGTAAGNGLPYELFSGDIMNVSDRTLRIIVNEMRRFAEQRQWHTIIPQFCQKVRGWWVDVAVLAGHVSEREAPDVRQVEWAPQGWAYIHPVQDVQSKVLEVQHGFRSRSSVVSAQGDDIDATDEERAADKAREKTLGLTQGVVEQGQKVSKPAAQPPAGGSNDGSEDDPQDDRNDDNDDNDDNEETP